MDKTIALITDFGLHDTYVGVMKGVMRYICPPVDFIDITHSVPPQSVRNGALALRNSYRYFRKGTVFLVVVDPGVGTKRRAIAAVAGGYAFVAPDNGVLSYVLDEFDDIEAVTLENPKYQLDTISRTFHGRDIFAPAAAYLARGDVPLADFGQSVTDLVTMRLPQMQLEGKRIVGEVTHIDHFGNIVTSIGLLKWMENEKCILNPVTGIEKVMRITTDDAIIKIRNEDITGIMPSYNDAIRGELLALIGSDGFLEIAINQGNAAAKLDAQVGDMVEFLPGKGWS